MARYYTAEKAKFGGTTGTIIPFMRQLPSINFPDQSTWKTYVPAGYLRCDGSIYKADLFPILASIIGVGTACRFAKITSGTGAISSDSIQLPDLGSKFIRASNASGQYLNITTAQDTTLNKVGVETEVSSLVGSTASITYTGSFALTGSTNISFQGNPFFTSDNSGYTPNDFLTDDNFQAHGHDANVGIFTYLGKWKDSAWQDNGAGSGSNAGRTEGSNNMVTVSSPVPTYNNPSHNHQINFPTAAQMKANTNFAYKYNDNQTVTADGLVTTVSLTTDNVKKIDNAIMPYILVEYIIKI
jgi:microcystin-dependent protein